MTEEDDDFGSVTKKLLAMKISPEHQQALIEMGAIKFECQKLIFGANRLLDTLIMAFFSRIPYDDGRRKRLGNAHILLMSAPGYGKTGSARIMANTISSKYAFIGGTPDLKESDVKGYELYHPPTGKFMWVPGPIFSNIIVFDEINRIPPKTQAFSLQALEERMVPLNLTTMDADGSLKVKNFSRRLTPISDNVDDERLMFFCIATGNQFEQEGTYPLPEAQLDRFAISCGIYLPNRVDEKRICVEEVYGKDGTGPEVQTIMSPERALEICHMPIDIVKEHPDAKEYRQRLTENSRPNGVYEDPVSGEVVHCKRESALPRLRKYVDDYVKAGLSPRANFHFQAIARTRAFMQGREYVSVDDIKYVAPLIMTHRIILRREARGCSIKQHHVVSEILKYTETKIGV